MTPNPPTKLGRYEIKKLLGRGAMGRVYLAEDPVIGREVAVKTIHAHAGLEGRELEEMQGRFEREFRAGGTLSHPNIVTVFDVGQEDEISYLAMEYVAGESLESVLASDERSLSFGEIADLADQLAGALDYAHSRGIVHRDIKPANVLMTWDGQAKITDFGIVKMTTSTMTRTGTIVGTPAYMSPEQVLGNEITGASDQFSLAVILYQMLTGERPFGADNPTSILYKIVHQDPLPPQAVNRELPSPVDEVILKALAKDAAERYSDCRAFARAIREALGEAVPEGDMTLGPADFDKLADVGKGGGMGWLPAALVALVLVGGGAWFLARELGILDPAAVEAVVDTVTVKVVVAPPDVLGAEIWVNGEKTDFTTPATVEVSGPTGESRPVEVRSGGEVLASRAVILESGPPLRWAPEVVAGGIELASGDVSPDDVSPDEATVDDAPPSPQSAPTAAPETLSITSNPAGARVLLDGEAAGTTPTEIEVLPGQQYTLRLELDGHEAQGMALAWERLSDAQRRNGALSFRLKPIIPPGFVTVAAAYPVTVTVGGRTHGPDARLRISLPPGQYEVTAAAPEVFLRQTRQVQVTSDEESPLTLPPVVPITITAMPGNCRISIDGRFVDFPPLIDLPVAAGDHEILFEWPTLGQSTTQHQTISANNRRFTARAPNSGGASGGTP